MTAQTSTGRMVASSASLIDSSRCCACVCICMASITWRSRIEAVPRSTRSLMTPD